MKDKWLRLDKLVYDASRRVAMSKSKNLKMPKVLTGKEKIEELEERIALLEARERMFRNNFQCLLEAGNGMSQALYELSSKEQETLRTLGMFYLRHEWGKIRAVVESIKWRFPADDSTTIQTHRAS